jgi:hypothetical protein
VPGRADFVAGGVAFHVDSRRILRSTHHEGDPMSTTVRHTAPTASHFLPVLVLAALAAFAALPADARATPVLGFVEEFADGSTASWSGGTPFSNPGAGGYLGPADGYLLLENNALGQLGARGSGEEYFGDWTASGITQIRVWLNDVGADDALEMHLSIGDGAANFWQYNVGFLPPLHAWGEYVVDLSSGANWTQIRGPGTFPAALTVVDRVHIRHDPPPFAQIPNPPDAILADVGMDHIVLTNGLVGVESSAPAPAHPVELAPPYPNPARGPVSCTVRAADGGPIRIEIVDVSGRSLRRAVLADAGNGPRTWLWDGKDDGGRQVPAGVYRVRASGASGGMSRPIVRVN